VVVIGYITCPDFIPGTDVDAFGFGQFNQQRYHNEFIPLVQKFFPLDLGPH
jgi:hypothetical protein